MDSTTFCHFVSFNSERNGSSTLIPTMLSEVLLSLSAVTSSWCYLFKWERQWWHNKDGGRKGVLRKCSLLGRDALLWSWSSAHPESAIEWVFIFSYFPSQASRTVGYLHLKNNNEHYCFSCSGCSQDFPWVSPFVMLSLTGQQEEYSILLQVRPSRRRE